MNTSGAASGQGPSDGNGWVFNPPPGWPAPPPGWRPLHGWQPDPSWPQAPAGWNFWLPAGSATADGSPARADLAAGEVRLSFGGNDRTVRPGQTVRIGRSPENDLVTDEPTVSRQQAVLRWGPGGWEYENTGSAPAFLNGQQVTRLTVDRRLELALGAPDGPLLRIEPPAPPPPAPPPPAPPPSAGTPSPGAAFPGADGLTGDDVATALRILFPVRSWLHDAGWRQGLRLLVIVYALLPLIFLAALHSSSALSTPGWAYSLYVAPLWLMGFWMLIRPGRTSAREMLAGVGIVVWTVVWINVVTININDSLHISGAISFFPALVIGFNEEITKALPVLLAGLILLRYRSVKLNVRMAMFLGTIAGLTFGVAEQAFYTSSDIIGIAQAQSANVAVSDALAFAERIFVDGFQHAVWAGISGFFIGMALNYPRRRVQLIALGVAVAGTAHALNDFLAGSSIWLVILVQAASLLLFLGYTMSAASIERKVRETPLFRGQSMVRDAIGVPDQAAPR